MLRTGAMDWGQISMMQAYKHSAHDMSIGIKKVTQKMI
jgi:hypothetical protein